MSKDKNGVYLKRDGEKEWKKLDGVSLVSVKIDNTVIMRGIEKQAFIPRKSSSQNAFHEKHWSVYHKKHRKPWWLELLAAFGYGAHNDLKRHAKVIVYHKKRPWYDDANLRGGAKPIPDALKSLGWIKDDDDEWFYCDYEQKAVGEDGTTEECTQIILYRQESK